MSRFSKYLTPTAFKQNRITLSIKFPLEVQYKVFVKMAKIDQVVHILVFGGGTITLYISWMVILCGPRLRIKMQQFNAQSVKECNLPMT